MKELTIILHPTDFSANAKHALELACGLARHRRARLILLHVVPPVHPQLPRNDRSSLHSQKDFWAAEARLRLLDCGDLLAMRLLRTGDPASVIAQVAEQVKADVIVLGRPKPSPWNWLAERRLALTVAQTAPCPVLFGASPVLESKEPQGANGKSLQQGVMTPSKQVEFSSGEGDYHYAPQFKEYFHAPSY